MNDALRSDVFMRYNPETVACACIYLSARYMNIALPKQPPWFALFKVTEEQILDVCRRILLLYKREKVVIVFLNYFNCMNILMCILVIFVYMSIDLLLYIYLPIRY